VVLNSSCFGPCIEPPPPDGKFRFRLKRGLYDVSAIPPGPPPCPPDHVCPAVVVMPCEVAEIKRVRVKRHRFTHVELRIRNVCVA
jgi:hypothetical protein